MRDRFRRFQFLMGWSGGAVRAALLVALIGAASPSAASDQIYFPATDNVTDVLVQLINAETVRLDIATWDLSEGSIAIAVANRFAAGVPVRLIGDRGAIFEADVHTRDQFYWLANKGVPIRLRFNPTWFPEAMHWKAAIFAGQNKVLFGSANFAPVELAPFSSSNYDDETVMVTDDAALVAAFKAKFDRMWNDTTVEPQSIIGGPPYLKNWADACVAEPTGRCDFLTQYPNPAPMNINTARLEPDAPTPPELIWGQGSDFNGRLTQEIYNERTRVDLVVYRLGVDSITQALLDQFHAGVPVRIIVDANQYTNILYPEYWLTHSNIDKLWAAGIPVVQNLHAGVTHMKTLVTSTYATNASSNFTPNWQRDHDYFVPAATKPTIYQAIKTRFQTMWSDTAGFAPLRTTPPAAPTLTGPASNATNVPTNVTLVWNRAPWAVSFDVYLGTSQANMALVANVPAVLTPTPPDTYTWTPSAPLQAGTQYFWKVVSRTFATPINPAMVGPSDVAWFTTANGAPPPPTLPAPWVWQDVGATGVAGSSSYSNGVFTLNAAGTIWGSSDSFGFIDQPVSGDVTIVARLTAMQNTNTFAKAGLMLRESTAANAAHVILDVRPTGDLEFMIRPTAGAETTFLATASKLPPAWLRLRRSGTTVSGDVSADGTNWTNVGSTTLNISSSAVAGLVVCSVATNTLNTSTFDSVTVTGGGGPPPAPGTPASPSPANGATGVATTPTLTWSASGATTYDVKFGTTNPPAQVTSGQAAASYTPATLANNTQYFWQIVAHNAGGATAGPVWVFTTVAAAQPPGAPGAPNPADGATGVSPSPTLSWTSVGAATYDVKFGTANPPPQVTSGQSAANYTPATLANSTQYFWQIVARNANGATPGPVWSFTTAAAAPGNIVIYASDLPASALHGSWTKNSDPTSPAGTKLVTTDNGASWLNAPVASPTHYVDVTFNANAGVPYTIWLRLQALGNSKWNDSVWVQFSDAFAGGSQVFPLNSTAGLLVNLATDSAATSLNAWGWQNSAYWFSQPTTVTFGTNGAHTLRIQLREDGVQLDQIVLSPSTYLSSPPGSVTNDNTIVPKP